MRASDDGPSMTADGGPDAPVTAAQLADLAAGRLDADEARRVRARLATDPRLLAAYGALRARATAENTDDPERRPTPASEALDPRQTPTVDHPQHAPAQRLTPARAALLAGALVLTVAAVVGLGPAGTPPPPAVADTTAPVTVPSDRLATLWPSLGEQPADLGFMTEKDRMRTCRPFGTPQVLGARPVIVDGRYGVLLASVAEGEPSTVDLTVYSRRCGLYTDGVIARARVPRQG